MGREPVQISFDGIIYGEEAKDTLKGIRDKFKAGNPVPFRSDLTGIAEVSQVLIEDLQVLDISGSPKNFKYRIKLREYIQPKKKDKAPPSQDADAKKSVDQKADDSKNDTQGGEDQDDDSDSSEDSDSDSSEDDDSDSSEDSDSESEDDDSDSSEDDDSDSSYR